MLLFMAYVLKLVLFVIAFSFNFSFVSLIAKGICKLMVVLEGLKYFAFFP